jgi:hypothetical protein
VPGAATRVFGTAACVEEVRFRSGSFTLAGQWFTPETEGPFPAVLVASGSGPSVRGNQWTESLVAVLLAERVGVQIPDKRASR